LRQGASGPAVAALQNELGVPTNGKFDLATEKAVIEFQRRANLAADAIVGPRTWNALDRLSNAGT
jgi:peptidoglycan hydrolase-like protein with peptidoglycan-binding domain